MVILDEMEYLEVFVGATSMSMNERFTILAATSPFRGPAPRRGRRLSTNDGPLLNNNTAGQSQDIIDTVVHELGLDWRVQDLQQLGRQSRAGSQSRSRAGSVSRYGSNANLPGLVRANSWGNLSQHSGRSGLSVRSGQSGRSVRSGQSGRSRKSSRDRDFCENHTVSFTTAPRLDINRRLQMRDAWIRGRRGRGRGHNGHVQRGQIANHVWYQRQQRGGGWPRGRGPRGGGRQRGRRNRYRGGARGRRYPLTPRGRAGLTDYNDSSNETGNYARGNARRWGSGRGRGRGARFGSNMRGGASQNSMPVLKTLEQLDKELEEYMASAPDTLEKQLEEYMALNELPMDLE